MIRFGNPLPLALCAAFGSTALIAQTPVDAPPWWGVVDDVTVSLYWDFTAGSLLPSFAVVPSWYNPAITRVVLRGAAAPLLGNTNGHTDVIGFAGVGTGAVEMTVDNDPHLNWVKVFSFQADVLEGAGGSVAEVLKQQLGKYDRSSMKWSSSPIGNGWETVTVQAQLIPQPDDEEIDWSLVGAVGAVVAIDNVYVSSKCVKIGETDQDGDAMGLVVNGPIDLDALTASVPGSSVAAAVTEGPAPAFARTLWVAKRSPGVGTPHALVGTQAGAVTSTAVLPSAVATSPQGPVDLAVETIVPFVGPHVQFVYALLDERQAPAGNLRILAYDGQGAATPARDVVIPGSLFPSPTPAAGLAFKKSGNAGLGTFVVSDRAGNAFEFDRAGNPIDTIGNLPLFGRGLGYDPVFGRYYLWTDQPLATPRGPLQANGIEVSAYDDQFTGTRFFGDLSLPGTPLGGVAAGLEALRSPANGRLRLCCVSITSVAAFYYELAAPFRYGASVGGVTGMQGLPFAGANNFTITLSGVPTAQFAALYVGFSNQVDLGTLTPLPFALSALGFVENRVLASLDMHGPFLSPSSPGEFAFTLPTLPNVFRGVPMFFQWLELDPGAQSGLALSQAGKTIVY